MENELILFGDMRRCILNNLLFNSQKVTFIYINLYLKFVVIRYQVYVNNRKRCSKNALIATFEIETL